MNNNTMKMLAFIGAAVAAGKSGFGLEVGIAGRDVTPMTGIPISGYYQTRICDGVLDPLETVCLAFSDGHTKALVFAVDSLQLPDQNITEIRAAITAATGIPEKAIYITSTHTHTGPMVSREKADNKLFTDEQRENISKYCQLLNTRCAEAAKAALSDLAPARLSFARNSAKRISFVRRYLMKDGKYRTNPGVNNPDIVRPVGEPDETVQLLRIDREKKAPIAVINFQTHPDTVGGTQISADWPGFTRRYFEAALSDEGARCVFLNGTQGDVNHVCTAPNPGELNGMKNDFDDVYRGYAHAKHMGRVVAAAAMQVWGKCVPVDAGPVRYATKNARIPSNMPKPTELPLAREYDRLHREGRDAEIPFKGMELTTAVADAARKIRLEHGPEYFEVPLSAISIGQAVVFCGFPGEPFNDIGKVVKNKSRFTLTIPTCLTNGSRGYFPFSDAYEQGGYESRTSNFGPSVADDLIAGQLDLLKSLTSEE